MDLLKIVLGAVALGACDPLVGAGYRGEPLFSFSGQLVAYDVDAQGYEFRTTLLWLTDPSVDPITSGPRLASAVEQPAAAVELRFPAEFRIDVFAQPDEEMLVPGTGLGIALIVVYEDRDRNGRLSLDAHPSELVGGARYEALVFARDAAAAAAVPFDEPVAVGFQLVRIPLFCAQFVPPPDCTAPLGTACTSPAECGEGALCLNELDGVSWPGGACALGGGELPCTPTGSIGIYVDRSDAVYFVQGCYETSECRDGYRCDPSGLSCVPVDAPPFEPHFAPSLPKGETCDVDLGAPCVNSRDCGAGECLVRSNGKLFPGGYCTLPIFGGAASPACEPQGGSAIPWLYREDGAATHWFRQCASERDCRHDEGYTCDPWLEVCLPVAPVALELESQYVPFPPCYGAFGR